MLHIRVYGFVAHMVKDSLGPEGHGNFPRLGLEGFHGFLRHGRA